MFYPLKRNLNERFLSGGRCWLQRSVLNSWEEPLHKSNIYHNLHYSKYLSAQE